MMELFVGALVFGAGAAVGAFVMAVQLVGPKGQDDDYTHLIRALDKTQADNRNLRRTNAELAAALHEHHHTH